jgi:hypothetical protein
MATRIVEACRVYLSKPAYLEHMQTHKHTYIYSKLYQTIVWERDICDILVTIMEHVLYVSYTRIIVNIKV